MVERVFGHAVVGPEGELFERGTTSGEVEGAANEGFLLGGGELHAGVDVDVVFSMGCWLVIRSTYALVAVQLLILTSRYLCCAYAREYVQVGSCSAYALERIVEGVRVWGVNGRLRTF